MTRLKAIFSVGIVCMLFFVINACCDEGFYYKWQNVIVQQFSNGEPVSETVISRDDFRLRAYLISSKSANSGIRLPKLIERAYASDCQGKYQNIDLVDDIDIILLSNENGLEVKNVVTFLFKAVLDSSPKDKMEVFDLPAIINGESSNPIEYFDMTLKENYDEEIKGQFIIMVTLADDRVLTDTTETLTIKL
jgi:hypothetical protein